MFEERCFAAFDFTEGERQPILATASKALSRAMTVWRNCLPNSSLFGPFVMALHTACASNRPQRSSIEMPTRTGPLARQTGDRQRFGRTRRILILFSSLVARPAAAAARNYRDLTHPNLTGRCRV